MDEKYEAELILLLMYWPLLLYCRRRSRCKGKPLTPVTVMVPAEPAHSQINDPVENLRMHFQTPGKIHENGSDNYLHYILV